MLLWEGCSKQLKLGREGSVGTVKVLWIQGQVKARDFISFPLSLFSCRVAACVPLVPLPGERVACTHCYSHPGDVGGDPGDIGEVPLGAVYSPSPAPAPLREELQPCGQAEGCAEGRAQGFCVGLGRPAGWGRRMPGPGEDSLQQASPSSSSAILLLLLVASMLPKICSQPLSSTAGQRAGTIVRGTGCCARTSVRSKTPAALGEGAGSHEA